MSSSAVQDAERFVEELGRALHTFGTPAHSLEEAMGLAARGLGLVGQFFSSPTAIFVSFGEREERHIRLVRVEPGEVDLEKLGRLDEVLGRVLRGELSAAEANAAVDAIVASGPRYGAWATTLACGLASGAAARFFGGGWREVAVGAGLGLVIGLLSLAARRLPTLGRVFEPVAAMVAALTAAVATAELGSMATYVVTLSGLIVLIPGLTLTVALRELATRHLVSGSARLAGALLTFLTIGFGVALGDHLGSELVGAVESGEPVPLPAWTELVALTAAAVGFTVLFRARPRDAGWILLAGALAIAGGRGGVHLLGPELGAFLGAVLVGAGSNLYARRFRKPASIIQLPGLMLLVPGSLGFRSVASLLESDTLSGVQAAFAMTLVAIALVTGLLLSNVFLPPRQVL